MRPFDIYKAAGIIIKDRRLLVTRSRGKSVFIAPGGKLEGDESPRAALVRELKEEVRLKVKEDDLKKFGVFYAEAAGSHNAGKRLRMDVYLVNASEGKIMPSAEIEEIRWITTALAEDLEVGSIFAHEVLPRLAREGLVD